MGSGWALRICKNLTHQISWPDCGGGCDIIAVCGQEATYKVKAVRERALGRFTGTIISATGLVPHARGDERAINAYCSLAMGGENDAETSLSGGGKPQTKVRSCSAGRR